MNNPKNQATHVTVSGRSGDPLGRSPEQLGQQFGTRSGQALELTRARGRAVMAGRGRIRRGAAAAARVEGQIGRDLATLAHTLLELGRARLRHLRLEHLAVRAAQRSLAVSVKGVD